MSSPHGQQANQEQETQPNTVNTYFAVTRQLAPASLGAESKLLSFSRQEPARCAPAARRPHQLIHPNRSISPHLELKSFNFIPQKFSSTHVLIPRCCFRAVEKTICQRQREKRSSNWHLRRRGKILRIDNEEVTDSIKGLIHMKCAFCHPQMTAK